MVMSRTTALDRIEEGCYWLDRKAKAWDRRQDYLEGRQDLPYAPEGVNEEYEALRVQAIANWLDLAMSAPLQRMRVSGFRTGRNGDADQEAWDNIWQPNSLDSRQAVVYLDMVVHAQGLMSVWPNAKNLAQPIVRPESGRQVHLSMKLDDPWSIDWAVKRVHRRVRPQRPRVEGFWLPENYEGDPDIIEVAWVYDIDQWQRWERPIRTTAAFLPVQSEWEHKEEGTHVLDGPPFVPFDNKPTSTAKPRSDLAALMPMQDAINTIRFQTLLAMQFSAYRQRIVTGFDPVARDENGTPIFQKNADGSVITDPRTGLPMPVVVSPGRPGVDRLLVFPGDATNIFDLDESDLGNYVTVLGEFLSQFFAVGQVPPQYLLAKMANLSGDALTAAESTLNSNVKQLRTQAGESNEAVMRKGNLARGESNPDLASEIIWDETEARSFAQTVDAIVKLISGGMDPQDAWEFLPNATPPQIKRWTEHAEARAQRALGVAGLKLPEPPTGPGGQGQGADNGGSPADTGGLGASNLG